MVNEHSYSVLDSSDAVHPPATIARSPNTTVNLKQRRRCNPAWIENGWILELLSLGLGCILLVVIAVVLKSYDHQQQPQFGILATYDTVSLNTIIVILGTAMQASILFPVAECIGQLKWQWMQSRDRRLKDLSTFDSASRGIWGSGQLLWLTKLTKLATLGALVVLSAVLVNPLLQQLILIDTQSVSSKSSIAVVPILSQWSDPALATASGIVVEDLTSDSSAAISAGLGTGTKAAIINGLFAENTTIQPLAPICPTGNCTFPTYRSLAICYSISNVTDRLKIRNTGVFGLSADNYIVTETVDGVSGFMNVSLATTPQYNHSINYKNVTAAVADVFVILALDTQTTNVSVSAYEFILEWCFNEYNTSVSGGISSTKIIHSDRNLRWSSESSYVSSDYSAVDPQTHAGLVDYFSHLFTGTIRTLGSGSKVATSDAIQALFEPFNTGQGRVDGPKPNTTTLVSIVANVATSMTNHIRTVGPVYYGRIQGEPAFPSRASGAVLQQVDIVTIRWPWISGPAIFVALAAVFVITTVIAAKRRDMQAWKSSTSAVLRALDTDLHRQFNVMTTPSVLSDQDDSIRVRLVYDGRTRGWKLAQSSTHASLSQELERLK